LASQRQQLELTETTSTKDQNLREPLEEFDRQFSQGKSYVKKRKIDRRGRSTDRSKAALEISAENKLNTTGSMDGTLTNTLNQPKS
tara:strand:+ start:112 stop:369 length:258 start_codon:yes stop_codon:yes gene_type:complete